MSRFARLPRRFRTLGVLAPLCGMVACGEPAPEPTETLRREALAPPPVARPASFIGAWTTASHACARPWIINQRRLISPDGVVCRFEDVRAEAEGWRVTARCDAATDLLDELYFETDATPKRRLNLQGGPFSTHRLVLCGSDVAAP